MKRNLKLYVILFILFLLIFGLAFPVYAFGQDELNQEEYSKVLEQYDLSAFDELDNTSKDLLDELGLTDFNYSKIVDFSVTDFLNAVKDTVLGSAQTPLEATALILVIILLSALFQSFKKRSAIPEWHQRFLQSAP